MACCIYVCQRYQMLKIFGTEVVHKGTEGDLVVVPKATSTPFRHRIPKWICTEMDYPMVPKWTGTERDLPRAIAKIIER